MNNKNKKKFESLDFEYKQHDEIDSHRDKPERQPESRPLFTGNTQLLAEIMLEYFWYHHSSRD